MSIAFSQFNENVANPARVIARGLGWGVGGRGNMDIDVNTVLQQNPYIPNTRFPDVLTDQLTYLRDRWETLSETDMRTRIDTFIQAIMQPMPEQNPVHPNNANPPGAINQNLKTAAEPHMAAANVVGQVALNQKIGHGHLDYLICQYDPDMWFWRPSVIIEAKASLGGNGEFGSWQLCAQLATAKQMAGNLRRTRGVLTDGRQWRFFELDASATLNAPELTCTNAYDANNANDLVRIIQLLQRYVYEYASAGPLL